MLPPQPSAVLPPLYARWMAECLGAEIPNETLATCHDCAMCAKPGSGPELSASSFRPDVKCCSYLPELPNFLVGRVLADEDPAAAEGRGTLEERIAARVAVTPLGVAQTPVYRLLYEQKGRDVFGRSSSMRCPHYVDRDGGLCGIWRNRNSVCATYFCRHDRGVTGQELWGQTLNLLTAVERALSLWVVAELGVSAGVLRHLLAVRRPIQKVSPTADDLDGRVGERRYAELWGAHAGAEREFYMEAARLVDALTWADVVRVCGVEVALGARLAQDAFTALAAEEIPQVLAVAPFTAMRLNEDTWRIQAVGQRGSVDLPLQLIEALRHFDGQAETDEVLMTIAVACRRGMPRHQVRLLVDQRILVPQPHASATPPQRGGESATAAAPRGGRTLPLYAGARGR